MKGRDSWDSWTVDSGLLVATRAVAAAAESHVREASPAYVNVFICMAQVYTMGIFLKLLVYIYPYHWLNCPAT